MSQIRKKSLPPPTSSPPNGFISLCSFASRKIAMVKWLTAIYRPRSFSSTEEALSHSISRGSSRRNVRLSFSLAPERNAYSILLRFNRGKRSVGFHRNFISFFRGRASEEIERENLMRLRRFFFFVSTLPVDENENFVGILFFNLEDWRKVRSKSKEIYIYI